MRQQAHGQTTRDSQVEQKPDFRRQPELHQLPNQQLPLQNSVFDSGYYSPNLKRRSPSSDDKPGLTLSDLPEKLLHAHPRGMFDVKN